MSRAYGESKQLRDQGRASERELIVRWLRNVLRLNRPAQELATAIENREHEHYFGTHVSGCADPACVGCPVNP